METDVKPKQPRRRHSAQFKAEVVAACLEPGVSVSAVARRYDLNDNLVHQWRRGRGVGGAASGEVTSPSPLEFIAMSLPVPVPVPVPMPMPMPMPMPATTLPPPPDAARATGDAAPIRLEIRRGGTVVDVSWPVTAAADCAAFLREWLAR